MTSADPFGWMDPGLPAGLRRVGLLLTVAPASRAGAKGEVDVRA
jgi:hypothetical protein